MNSPDPNAIKEELASIHNFIEAVRGILKTGFMPSMAGLEDRVGNICKLIQQSPKEVQQQFLPTLGALLRQLNDCEDEMRAFNAARQPTDKK